MTDFRDISASDAIDVADIGRTIRARWRTVVGCVALGVVGALAVLWFAPRRFEGAATVLARPVGASGGSILSRIGGAGDLLGGLAGAGSGGAIETEIQMLRSRALAERVIDSLLLQVRVRVPSGVAPSVLVSSLTHGASHKPRTLSFEKQQDGSYSAEWNGQTIKATPGVAVDLGIGALTLRPGSLPESFTIMLLDREDAINRFSKRLEVGKAGGELVRVAVRGDDSVTAANAANLLVSQYVDQRRSTDRSANQRRVEYVTAQVDSTGAALAATERELRRYQETSAVLDAEAVGRVDLERESALRHSLAELDVNAGAMQQLVAQVKAGRLTARDLAAYPALLSSSAVAPLVSQLSSLETERIKLLEHRTLQDPQVIALDSTMRTLERTIIGMAETYANAVSRQREALKAQVDSLQQALLALPATAERGGRLKRDVLRLTQLYTALQAQLVEARLGVIGEGGEARQVDVAEPPKDPAFPPKGLTLALGSMGGLAMGLVLALLMGSFGRWLRNPAEIERALGVSAQQLRADRPIAVLDARTVRTLLLIPLNREADAGAVAERLARSAQQRALAASVLDLSGRNGIGLVGAETTAGRQLEQMERAGGMVIVRLPTLDSDEAMAVLAENRTALVVAPPGPVNRHELTQTLATLRRLNVPCAGVLIGERANGTRRLPG
jgi:tyrosine-protein kinase Etk/Wzc